MKTNTTFEAPMTIMERSEFGKMLEEIQVNLNVAKGEVYSLIANNKKKSVITARKCLDNIRKIGFNLRKKLHEYKKAMPIRKLRRKATKNA